LTSIAVLALLAGTVLDWLYGFMDLDPRATFGAATSFLPAPVKTLGALIVVALLVSSIRRTSPPGEWVGLCRKVAALSGNRLTWRRLGWVGSGTIAILYLGSGLITVGPGEVALRQRFGRILEPELGPGLHYRLPWPIETHELVATQLVRRLEFGLRDDAPQQLEETTLARSRLTIGGPSNPAPEPLRARAVWFQNKAGVQDSFLLTGDANLIDLRFAVQYRVKSAVQFVLAAGDPEALLRSVVAVALRDAVATTGIDEIYTRSRGELERRVGVAVQRALDRYRSGIDLLAVRFLYVHAPEEVHDAFRDVASAQEDKLRTINRAGTFAVEKVNEAKAEAAATLEEALAFAEERRLRARGDADGFGLKAAAYRHRPELTRFRLHLEEAERALAGPNKVIRPGRGELESFEMWLASPSVPIERR
jgi:HflK protein